MSKVFSIIYTIVLVIIGCENIYTLQKLHDINVLVVFLSLAFLTIVFISDRKKESEDISWGFLPITLMAFLLYSAISFYFSANADLSIYPALKSLGALFLTLALLYLIKDIETLKQAFLLIFILAGMLAMFGILQQFVPSLLHQQNKFNSTSTSLFTNPNFFSGYLVIHIPIGFYLMCHGRSGIGRMGLAGLWVMVWIALGFSGSPGGQLLAIAQALSLTAYLYIRKDLRNLKLLGWSLLIAILIYFSIIEFISGNTLVGAEALQDSLIRRPWVWEHLENRFMYWTGAWSIFKDHWLVGSGLWTFIELYPQTGLKYTPPHAHNMYLQTLAETGLVGFGFLMACLIILFKTFVGIFKRGGAERKDIGFYIAISLSCFLLHNLIEYNWLTSNFIYIFVFLIISVEILNRDPKINNNIMWNAKYFGPKIIPFIIIVGAFSVMQYYRYHREIHEILTSETIEQVSGHTVRAQKFCNRCGSPSYLSGIANLEAFRRSKEKPYLVQAEHEFNTVLRLNPYGLGTYLMLGETNRLLENFPEAKNNYKNAMQDPRYRNAALQGLSQLNKTIEKLKP